MLLRDTNGCFIVPVPLWPPGLPFSSINVPQQKRELIPYNKNSAHSSLNAHNAIEKANTKFLKIFPEARELLPAHQFFAAAA